MVGCNHHKEFQGFTAGNRDVLSCFPHDFPEFGLCGHDPARESVGRFMGSKEEFGSCAGLVERVYS